MIVRMEHTSMFYRTGLPARHEVFALGRGWVPVESLRAGDLVSRSTVPPRYARVTSVDDEAE